LEQRKLLQSNVKKVPRFHQKRFQAPLLKAGDGALTGEGGTGGGCGEAAVGQGWGWAPSH
jgi:hypothetical protein